MILTLMKRSASFNAGFLGSFGGGGGGASSSPSPICSQSTRGFWKYLPRGEPRGSEH